MCLNTGYLCKCLLEGDPCEPCRMTVKHKEAEEGQAGATFEPEITLSSAVVAHKERSRNWGWMVSGIICVNILILGCAFVSGSAYDDINISTAHLQIYLIVLLILTTIWMICYVVYTSRQEDAIVYKDSHAGPVWLRGKI